MSSVPWLWPGARITRVIDGDSFVACVKRDIGFHGSVTFDVRLRLNRKRYDARWLWNQAKQVDEWEDTNPGDDNGTSVRAAMDVLRGKGHVLWGGGLKAPGAPRQSEGIAANRWARTVSEVMAALKSPANERMGAVRILNSWGRDYPRRVWMPFETLQRLLDEDGEATLVTDR